MIDPTLRSLLVSRLDASNLDEHARVELLRATGPARQGTGGGDGPTSEVYLRSVTVEGFRGIGPSATLELKAQPGLTIVVGRNGSGKSSFAEGLELLTTGTTRRWSTQTKNWQSAWQCLHHEGPTRLGAELVIAGVEEPVVLQQTWAPGVEHGDDSDRAAVAGTLATHGWDDALTTFRPFLAYAELASMFDKTSTLYEALSPILGLEDVDAILERLAQERLALDNHAKKTKFAAAQLVSELDVAEPRAAALADLLAEKQPDLEAVRAHLDAHPPGQGQTDGASAGLREVAGRVIPDDEAITSAWARLDENVEAVAALATTDAARALATADLLTRALDFRDPERLADDCPVCSTPSVLDADWAEKAREHAVFLREQAKALRAAEQERDAARSASQVLAQALTDNPGAGLGDVLVAASDARTAAVKARALLAEQDTTWRGQVEATTAWLAQAASCAKDATRLKALKAAEKWLKSEADALRNERFAPIAKQAVANWELLRHESNVELHDISIRSKKTAFDVRADGHEASAMGVMSQGELLALAVSVFLPRAGLDESPFRFAVIDDPVQSMDPAKVDGLARILDRAAKTRQVVVFTHDDRLPETIRRLKLPATVLQVNRRAKSQVSVDVSRTPLTRHLADAKTMAKSTTVPAEVRQSVVPTLCRNAIEAACAELLRARVVAEGRHASEADEALLEEKTLRDQLVLALLGPGGTHETLSAELAARCGEDGPKLVAAVNAGAHGKYKGDVLELHGRTQELLHGLMP